MLTTHPRRRRRVRPPAVVTMTQQLERIKTKLRSEGYRIRVSFNDDHAWRAIHPDRHAFHLICYRAPGEWIVLPHNYSPERDQLVAWVKEATDG